MQSPSTNKKAVIIGAGPAGLIAAEYLASAGYAVTVYDRMPSPLRKFLLAGRGGLNLTHAEPSDAFMRRYGNAPAWLEAALQAYRPDALRKWAADLGENTFVGTSGRVFPKSFKATPLARAWLRRLDRLGVRFAFRHEWQGWTTAGALRFATVTGPVAVRADATLLALGGASWPRMGSNGAWQAILAGRKIDIEPLKASNAGLLVDWPEAFVARNAGAPLKGMSFRIGGQISRAEAVISSAGLEGGAIYALSRAARDSLAAGSAQLVIDARPDLDHDHLAARLASMRKGETLANSLRKLGLAPLVLGLLRTAFGPDLPRTPADLAKALKALPITFTGITSIDRAISSAGGIAAHEVDDNLMLHKLPGIFVAGEMLDWDAPTGGYLLQACFATGMAAAKGMAQRLALA